MDAAKTPYYDLVFEVPQFARIQFNNYLEYSSNLVSPDILNQWNDIISEEYHNILDDWDGFDQNIQMHQWHTIFHGVGPLFWPHPLDWRSEAVKTGKALVPDETKANVDDLESLVILHSYRADQLLQFLDHEKIGKSGRWNRELVENAIVQSATSDIRDVMGTENFDLYQRAIRSGDYYWAMNRSDRIYVASLFIKELETRKVSHYILTDVPVSENEEEDAEDPDKEVGYLFIHKNKYEDFSQVIVPFFFDVGRDGTWHNVKGLGPKIYDFCDIENRMTCQMIDGAVIGSGVTLEAQDANSLEETQIVMVGGATVVQPGYKVVQTRIAESLNGALAIKRDLQNTLQSNTGNYRQRVSGEDQEPTLGQAQLNAQQQAMLSKGAVNRYYYALDRWHRETLRRLLNRELRGNVPGAEEAEYFRECCTQKGIPDEILKIENIRKVKASRSVGYGSPNMRDIAAQKMLQLLPMAGEEGKNFILRSNVASIPGVGQAQVDAIFPPINKQRQPPDHEWEATMENNELRRLGGQTRVTDNQNHATHFGIHFQDAMQDLQGLQAQGQNGNAQGNPMQTLIHLEQAGPHLKQHLDKLGGDPTREKDHKQMVKAWTTLGKATDKLKQNVDEMLQSQQANQPPPQPDPEHMAQLAKIHGELGLKAEKMHGDMALKAQKQTHTQSLMDKKTAFDLRIKAAQSLP
jgi:hypothetical protein